MSGTNIPGIDDPNVQGVAMQVDNVQCFHNGFQSDIGVNNKGDSSPDFTQMVSCLINPQVGLCMVVVIRKSRVLG